MVATKNFDQLVALLVGDRSRWNALKPRIAECAGEVGIGCFFEFIEDLVKAQLPGAKVRLEPWFVTIKVPVFPVQFAAIEPQCKLAVHAFGFFNLSENSVHFGVDLTLGFLPCSEVVVDSFHVLLIFARELPPRDGVTIHAEVFKTGLGGVAVVTGKVVATEVAKIYETRSPYSIFEGTEADTVLVKRFEAPFAGGPGA